MKLVISLGKFLHLIELLRAILRDADLHNVKIEYGTKKNYMIFNSPKAKLKIVLKFPCKKILEPTWI